GEYPAGYALLLVPHVPMGAARPTSAMSGIVRQPGAAAGTLSAVEEISCHFDRPGEPNNLHLEVHLTGRLEVPRLGDALATTLAAHPRARVRRVPPRHTDRRYHWEIVAEPDVDPLSVAAFQTPADLAFHRERFLATAPSL